MSLLYEARELKKYYGNRLVLDVPSFHVESGETVILMGHNGSGKSTLLRLLAFLERPSSGILRFYGNEARPRLETTLLLQEPFLFRESVFRNVTLGLLLRGRRHDLVDAYTVAMRQAGFEDPAAFAKRRTGTLSGGEKQRVALASRLILNPRVLLLDEPTSSVDAASAGIILKALKTIRASGTAIVCATHDRESAEHLGGRIAKLDGGRFSVTH